MLRLSGFFYTRTLLIRTFLEALSKDLLFSIRNIPSLGTLPEEELVDKLEVRPGGL